MPHINGMIVQSDGSKLHVVFVMETLAKQFPYSIWKIGGKNDRDTSEGGMSFHASGRACDIYLDANDLLDKKLGDLLFKMFYQNGVPLKVDHVIWNRKIWSQENGGPRIFSNGNGGPHTNHIHVAFKGDSLNNKPTRMVQLCRDVHAQYIAGNDGAADRASGIYGKAFQPKRPNVRLTHKQRHKVMLENLGMKGSDPGLKLYKAARRHSR